MDMENKKREEGIIGSVVTTLLFLIWNLGFLFILIKLGFDPVGFVLYSVVTFILGLMSFEYCFGVEKIRTLGFTIFEFEMWDKNNREYVKRYDWGIEELHAKYFFHKQTSTMLTSTKIEDIKERALSHSYSPTKDKTMVMKEILDYVESIIKNRESIENVKIKNIVTLESHSLNELIKLVNGK